MKVAIIKIGNAKGIRLPKSLLNQYDIEDEVELILGEEQIILKPVYEPRKGWDQALAEMHNNGDDELLINDMFDDENFEEW